MKFKNIMALFFFCLLSMAAAATMPGDEEFESNNAFCKYEIYKKRIPDACPKVNEIVYGFTVYGNILLQDQMKIYLEKIITDYKNKSKHNDIYLRVSRSNLLASSDLFEQFSVFHVPTEKTLKLDFTVRLIPVNEKYISHFSVTLGSDRFVKNSYEISDPLSNEVIEAYLKETTKNYIKYYLAPVVFPDSSSKVD